MIGSSNPEYPAWLLSLPLLERERLLGGNWKIRPTAGPYFKREWCTVVDEVPAELDVVRYWDLAATSASLDAPEQEVRIQFPPAKSRANSGTGSGQAVVFRRATECRFNWWPSSPAAEEIKVG